MERENERERESEKEREGLLTHIMFIKQTTGIEMFVKKFAMIFFIISMSSYNIEKDRVRKREREK